MFHYYRRSISKGFRDIEAQTYLGHGFDLSRSRDVIGHVTIRFPTSDFLWVFHWYRHSISEVFRDIEAQTYLGRGFDLSRSLDVIGHVIIFPQYVVSYRWSVDTFFLTATVIEIFA